MPNIIIMYLRFGRDPIIKYFTCCFFIFENILPLTVNSSWKLSGEMWIIYIITIIIIWHYCAYNSFKDVRETTLSFICFSAKRLLENKVCSATIIRRPRFHYYLEGAYAGLTDCLLFAANVVYGIFGCSPPPSSLRHLLSTLDVLFPLNLSSLSRIRLHLTKWPYIYIYINIYPRALTKYCPKFMEDLWLAESRSNDLICSVFFFICDNMYCYSSMSEQYVQNDISYKFVFRYAIINYWLYLKAKVWPA